MKDRPRELPVDYAELAEILKALAYGSRLELLDILRFPRLLAEIRLQPQRSPAGENPERAASKQAVQAHLDRLVEAGLVHVERLEVEGRAVHRYVAQPQRLYALSEGIRRITVRYAGRGAGGDATGTLVGAAATPRMRGPRLLLVHGVYEGKAFALSETSAVDGRWTIGRRQGLPICLDYDPFVSVENAFVSRAGETWSVTDIASSKNGTFVNWEPLARGQTQALQAGDVVGVGRSLLSFIPE